MAKGFTDQLDKILVGLGVAALVAVGAWVFMGLGKPLPNIDEVTRVVKKQAEEVGMTPFMALLDEVDARYISREEVGFGVLVSEARVPSVNTNGLYYLIPQDATVCPFTGEAQPDLNERDSDGDGMRDVYELKYGLNPLVDDLLEDKDEDGFNNGEEFYAETEPNNAEDHPPLVVKVRVAKAVNRPYPFEFQGVTSMGEGDHVFSLKLRSSQTHFLRVDQEKEGWKPVKYHYLKDPTPGSVNKSTLELENVKTGERISLRINKRGGSGDRWIAALVLLTDSTWGKKVEKGAQVDLEGTLYEVLRLSQSGAQLKNVVSGKEFTVEKITSLERQVLRGERVPSAGRGSDVFQGSFPPGGYPAR